MREVPVGAGGFAAALMGELCSHSDFCVSSLTQRYTRRYRVNATLGVRGGVGITF